MSTEPTLSELRAEFGRSRMLSMPIAGAIAWSYHTEEKARDTYVALAPDRENDGVLTVREVMDDLPQMTADLVVLSSCETGSGFLREAEGAIGFQRAFLARGARSLLVSLWPVGDWETAELMRSFYSHWVRDQDHPSKAEALRRAQTDLLAKPKSAASKHWAAFELVGAE